MVVRTAMCEVCRRLHPTHELERCDGCNRLICEDCAAVDSDEPTCKECAARKEIVGNGTVE